MLVIMLNFLEFTYEDRTQHLHLKDLLAFITGADKIPPMGFDQWIQIIFLYEAKETLPTTSTCVPCIRLPTIHCNYDSFLLLWWRQLLGHWVLNSSNVYFGLIEFFDLVYLNSCTLNLSDTL